MGWAAGVERLEAGSEVRWAGRRDGGAAYPGAAGHGSYAGGAARVCGGVLPTWKRRVALSAVRGMGPLCRPPAIEPRASLQAEGCRADGAEAVVVP